MDIKTLTQFMQLSMLSKITADDSSDSDSNGMDNQSSDMFEQLLQEVIQNQGNSSSNNYGGQILGGTDGTSDSIDSLSNGNTAGFSGNIDNAIEQASQKYGVDQDFIKAIIKQESNFHPNAVSGAGAEGLMQLMPKTAESLGVKNPFDVLENIDGGTKYIKQLMDSFGGSKELALSAYNGGIGRMNRRGVDTVGEIGNMPKETQNYVSKVMKAYETYKNS